MVHSYGYEGDETYRAHQRVQYADRKSGATRERLCEIKLRIRIVLVVLIQKLDIRIVH